MIITIIQVLVLPVISLTTLDVNLTQHFYLKGHGGVVMRPSLLKAVFGIFSPGQTAPMHLASLAAQGSGGFVQALWIWQRATGDSITPWYTYKIRQPGSTSP